MIVDVYDGHKQPGQGVIWDRMRFDSLYTDISQQRRSFVLEHILSVAMLLALARECANDQRAV